MVECDRCPWRIPTSVDGWEEALQAHRAHHAEQNGSARSGRGVPRWTREKVISAIQAWAAEHGRPPQQREATGASSLPNASSVREHCGSWADAIEQAGFPRPGRGGHPPPPAPRPKPVAKVATPPAAASLTELARVVEVALARRDQAAVALRGAQAELADALAELRAAIDRHASP
jgi:hypothetical protein